MRIAIVFDDLIQFGGAEKLLLAVHELYPNAPVYTSVASDRWLEKCADLRIDLETSFMQRLPCRIVLNRFYGLLGIHAIAFESFRFDNFDIVLSISARFAHGVITKPTAIHICYMNSPGRMFWESYDYFCKEKHFSIPLLSIRRLCDYASAQRTDYFIANSLTVKERIKKYYRRDSVVIYPFVDDLIKEWAGMSAERSLHPVLTAHPYYLVIARLNAWKRVDIAIEACRKANVNLKIIGEGPDKQRLEKLICLPSQQDSRDDGKIELLGYVTESEKASAILNCKALIVTQKEDFGIAALETMALGKPVIAYRLGGAVETVIEGVTGEFFDLQDSDCLATTLRNFNAFLYNPEDCKKQAGEFSKQKFLSELDDFVKKVYDSKNNLL